MPDQFRRSNTARLESGQARDKYSRLDPAPNEATAGEFSVQLCCTEDGKEYFETWLVGAKRSTELRFDDLPKTEQPKMLLAMAKEWANFGQFSATKPISHKEYAEARRKNVRVIGTRWF